MLKMKQSLGVTRCVGWAWTANLALAAIAPAATSLTNSLTGFTGDSTQAATQAALATAGFEFSSTDGLDVDFTADPTVTFDASGATFGTLFAGDGGRNYMRTIDSYAFDSYVAEVTVVVDTLATDVVFFGMGSGDIALWGVPDFAGVPSVFLTPEGGDPLADPPVEGSVKSNAIDGIAGDWYGPPGCPAGDWCSAAAPDLLRANAGTHRLRMTFDAATKQWVGAVDIDYTGGPFVADVSTATYDLSLSFDDGEFVVAGWPTNPSKIYFGGDDGAIFKDFAVTVAGAGIPGDFDGDNDVDGADFLKWQRDDGSAAGLAAWEANYPTTQVVAASAVPEPATGLLLLLGVLGVCKMGRGL
jgi:hypothetical protein